MPGPKKKTIEELEKEMAELIAKLGQCKQYIFTDFKDYRDLKWRINDPGTHNDNDDLRKMMNLQSAFLLGK